MSAVSTSLLHNFQPATRNKHTFPLRTLLVAGHCLECLKLLDLQFMIYYRFPCEIHVLPEHCMYCLESNFTTTPVLYTLLLHTLLHEESLFLAQLSLSNRWTRKELVGMKMTAFRDIVPCSLVALPWWWRQYARLKRWSTSKRLYSAVSQKAVIFILTTARTWNLN
jgi:hypothetical protein